METKLYQPVKAYLEGMGFQVKGEIGGCDLVGLNGNDPPVVVIGELKLSFNLELVLQGVHRAAAGDEIWLAARLSARGKGREADPRFRNLCRHLGFGMLGIDERGDVHVLVSPQAPSPRRNLKLRSRLVQEHQRRRGDPTQGGSTRKPIMTAYRQQALTCAAALAAGPQRLRDLKTDVPIAGSIVGSNFYGWFERVERGIYALTEAGQAALKRWPMEGSPALS